MQFAIDLDGEKIEAEKGLQATCPHCHERMIPKCGRIKIHHWAHYRGEECDSWFEPETRWHRDWKDRFPRSQVEIMRGGHVADVVLKSGRAVRLQSAAISPDRIEELEAAFGDMIWIISAATFSKRFYVHKWHKDSRAFNFRWKHYRPSWHFAKRPRYLDLGIEPFENVLADKHFDGERSKIEHSGWQSDLPADFRSASILKLNTFHDTGFGSVHAFTQDEFIGLLG